MHPIEHLRYIARATGADPGLIAREAADSLVEIARGQPAGLLPACRRLIDRHVAAGPVWWLSARMLREADPAVAGRRAADELDADATSSVLADLLDDGATAVVVGWPDIAAEALRRRGDVEVLAVEWSGEAEQLARRLRSRGSSVSVVPESGAATAAAVADAVVLEATAAGPAGILALPGSLAVAAVAARRQVPVVAVAGVGRVLPAELWDALLERLDASGVEPWERNVEVVPADLLSAVAGPEKVAAAPEGLGASTCPAAPELFRPAG
jgi:hypothetical protein